MSINHAQLDKLLTKPFVSQLKMMYDHFVVKKREGLLIIYSLMTSIKVLNVRKKSSRRKFEKKNEEAKEKQYDRKQQILKVFDHQFTHLELNKVQNISRMRISEYKPQLKGVFLMNKIESLLI